MNIGQVQLTSNRGRDGNNPGQIILARDDPNAAYYPHTFTFTTGGQLARADDLTTLAAIRAPENSLWFTQEAHTGEGEESQFVVCTRDKTKTPNRILCHQTGNTSTTLLESNYYFIFSSAAPNGSNGEYDVALFVEDEVCA